MAKPALPSDRPYHPTTFQERGVALPFTTPLLGGARARLFHNRGLELIVRNPGGGRGVYVMPLNAVTTLCRPTLHDKVISSRIAFLDTVTPATVRAVGRAASAEGLAGEAAVQAAKQAAATEAADRRLVFHHLVSAMIHQAGASQAIPGPESTNLDTRALQTFAWLAPRLGQSAAWGIGALNAIAETMTAVGVDEVGRLPGMVRRLGGMREQIAEWANAQRDGDRVTRARAICAMADFVGSSAVAMIAHTRTLADDMFGLLRLWGTDPHAVVRLAERPEWLVDGWEQICLIWDHADDNATRSAALIEIAEHVPAMPRELAEWGSGKASIDDVFTERGPIGLNEDWLTGGAVFDLIARNERLRAAVF